ncbi:MAG: TRAP transporter small permease subunit [Planctomycetaceae bacterium]|nr:TRAP transporter small permease subunit [Planctomycetaceae bacterium]
MPANSVLKRFEEAVLTILGASMTLVMIANVIMRYIFASSIIWAEEYVRITFVWAMFLAITTGFLRNEHIGFTNIMNRKRTTSLVREILYGAALMVVGGITAYFGNIYNGYVGEVSLAGTNLPTAVLLLPGIIAGVVWFLMGLIKAGLAVRGLLTGKE